MIRAYVNVSHNGRTERLPVHERVTNAALHRFDEVVLDWVHGCDAPLQLDDETLENAQIDVEYEISTELLSELRFVLKGIVDDVLECTEDPIPPTEMQFRRLLDAIRKRAEQVLADTNPGGL